MMGMPGLGMQPQIILLKEGTDSSQGKPQLISNINACMAVVDTIRTTLGPRGMDKLIHNDRVRNAGVVQILGLIPAALCDTSAQTLLRYYAAESTPHAPRQGQVTISNDGATIMRLLEIVHPAAKCLVDVSLAQDAEVSHHECCDLKRPLVSSASAARLA